ncbi:MAG: zf-TFIIB domain-containing protein [Sedimentisphaerales bacterium]|nr:zf-TFIIB domain-containing protein [Sedimentisphaerales bacterium]
MDCPVCRDAMITLELGDVEVDHCTNCGGIWLDSGELELLLDHPAQAQRLLGSFQETAVPTEQGRKCPICDRKMAKVSVGQGAPSLLIDKCPRSDGLWFDKGELQDILARAELDDDNRIQRLLADIFGKGHERPDAQG